MARKRHYHEEILIQRTKKAIFLSIVIPVIAAVTFILFGPQIASTIGFLAGNRDNGNAVDTIPPSAPVFRNPPAGVRTSTISLEGFAEPGSTIKLYVNGPETQTTTASTDGLFQFQDVQLNNGRNTLMAKAVDAAQNESAPSQSLSIELDTTPPQVEIESPEDGDVVRNLNNRVLIQGKVNEKATIKINDLSVVQKTDFSFEFLLGVEPGDVTVKIEVTDIAGNTTIEEVEFQYVRQQGS